MKSFILASALLFGTTAFSKAVEMPKDYAQTVKPATIKVLLQDKAKSLLLEVNGSYKIFCPYSDILLSSGVTAKRKKITPGESGISWGELLPGTYGIRIVPSHKETTIFVNGIQYKGCLEVYDIGGSLRTVNEVDVESYLRSSLATSFSDIKEEEVLNALTITARTNAYYLAQKQTPWHVTAEEAHYTGFATTLQNLAVENAITQTRHAIMTYQGKPFAASWTENSGGKTAAFSSVFSKDSNYSNSLPKGTTVPGMESERAKSCWSFQMAKKELATIAHLASVSHATICAERESGKVLAVKLADADGEKTVDFFTLQNAIGKTKLPSNDFTIEVLKDAIKFKGYGEGNGVGLCLHSATIMAKQGLDAKKILSTFFSDISIERSQTLSK